MFEYAGGEKVFIGEANPAADRWSTVISGGDCLTGIYGVYATTDRQADTRKLLSIGFYFGEPEETFMVLINTGTLSLNTLV